MGKQPIVYSFDTKPRLSSHLASFILQSQAAALAKHQKFKIAVSGGSLPSVLISLLTTPDIQWSKWEIFFADERAVPHTHPDSNYGLLKSELLDKIPSDNPHGVPTIVPIDESLLDDTQELADAYEQALVKSFAAKDSVKLPIFDLILLGCGPDGHTCSLFPGHELLREDIAWVAPIEDSPKPPPKRITLTLPVVTHAQKIVFVAMGAGKKEVMKTIFERPEEGLPCSLVNEGAGDRVVWFVDDGAITDVAGLRRGSI